MVNLHGRYARHLVYRFSPSTSFTISLSIGAPNSLLIS